MRPHRRRLHDPRAGAVPALVPLRPQRVATLDTSLPPKNQRKNTIHLCFILNTHKATCNSLLCIL